MIKHRTVYADACNTEYGVLLGELEAFVKSNEKEHATTVGMLQNLVTSQESNRQNNAALQKLLLSWDRDSNAQAVELRAIVERKKLQASLSDSSSVDAAIRELAEAGFGRGGNQAFGPVADVCRREPQGLVRDRIASAQSFLGEHGYPANNNQ